MKKFPLILALILTLIPISWQRLGAFQPLGYGQEVVQLQFKASITLEGEER